MKTGLIVEGGALRTAFACGVLGRWLEAGVHFDYTVGVSLGALAASYYHAGQRDALEAIYGDYIDAHGELGRLAALKGETAIDGPAFVKEALAAHPIDMEAFAAKEGALYAATTRADNGDAVYWRLDGLDIPKQLRHYLTAAAAWPGQDEAVDLVERRYYDARVSGVLPIEEALAQGCTHLVVLSTQAKTYQMERRHLSPKMAFALAKAPMTKNTYLLGHLHYNAALRKLHDMEAARKALVVAPVVESTSIHRYGVSMSAASEFYAEGLRLGEEALARVRHFLEG